MRWGWVAVGGVAVLAAGVWWTQRDAEDPPKLRLEAVTRQDVRAEVTATGALEAVTTVEVGTQVSGIVAELLADFNDHVDKDQVIARIDTSLLAADVARAEAEVEVATAQSEQAMAEVARVRSLAAQQIATPEELLAAETTARVAAAQARSARVALQRSRSNLGYATIKAPVAGTVVRRDVDVGQTVNAGMSAPTLFVLAGDLAQMQILVAVDEADIGKIKPAQAVRFTVPAYGERSFDGTVDKVRLTSSTVESVVTYTVVVRTDNADHALLPGMTATVNFVVDEVRDALCAPNAALRYSPEDALRVPEARQPADAAPAGVPASGGRGGREGRGRGQGGPRTLWVQADGGLLRPLTVEIGLQGATCTEVRGADLTEDLSVVSGVLPTGTTATTPASPFGGSGGSSGGGWRRPGGF